MSRCATLSLAAALLAGCASQYQAPVVERAAARPPAAKAAAQPAQPRADSYVVKRGDTLYSIALDNGLDYRELADWNGIANPNSIQVGQVLRLRPPPSVVQVQPAVSPGPVEMRPLAGAASASSPAPAAQAPAGAPTTQGAAGAPAQAAVVPAQSGLLKTAPKAMKLPYSDENLALLERQSPPETPAPLAPPAKPPEVQPPGTQGAEEDKVDWGWPAAGKVLSGFSESSNKGVDIAGKLGDPVYASASGRVVYSGSGLRGYGKLIIIKHNQAYLSAYAHNSVLLVKEGQTVVKGQKIAEIGDSDSDRPMLHFEIRRFGKPVDPLKYLPSRAPSS